MSNLDKIIIQEVKKTRLREFKSMVCNTVVVLAFAIAVTVISIIIK